MPDVPQPSLDRLVPFAGHPLVVGVTPDGPELVVQTALTWAQALGVDLYFAYVDVTRITVTENADGTVRHVAVDSDTMDDAWHERERSLQAMLESVCGGFQDNWHLRYLAGRPDRALTHLARAVDASAFIIGAHGTHSRWHAEDFLDHSIGVRLSHHQHRPVLIVPLSVVDWKGHTPWM